MHGAAPLDDDRHEDLITRELQQRFLEPQLRNFIFGSILVVGVAAFLWPHADQRGLVIWAVAVIATLCPIVVIRFLNPPFDQFYKGIIVWEVLSGLAWGAGSLIAMPRETIWQSILLMVFLGVLMSGASNSSHFFAVFLSFHLPLAVAVAIGFLFGAKWPVAPFLTTWLLGFAYVCVGAYEARQALADHVRTNIDLGRANLALDARARADMLTGAANRLGFTERLDARLAELDEAATAAANGHSTAPLSLAYLDIDRFKQINDEFGHYVGDELLRQTVERLQLAAHDGELVGRLGGDEFTMLSSVDADALGRRIIACFDEPLVIEGRVLQAKVSVGIASTHGDITGEELMRNADAALYASKNAGGGHHRVFDHSLQFDAQRRMTLESEVHSALVSGSIVPWLQPIVDLETGEIVAAEALATWEHPDGIRSASTFIEAIRQIGTITELTEQIVGAVTDFHGSMSAAGHKNVPISINVPSSHLDRLVGLSADTPLVIEITEETAIDQSAESRACLEALQAAGHRVWLDDFGTGFSSMAMAAQLPIDGLKIDREFVAELLVSEAMQGVVASMVELGKRLGVDVVAEGVENQAQAEMLHGFGVTKAQGHVWSPAVPMTQFAEWLRVDHRFATWMPTAPID